MTGDQRVNRAAQLFQRVVGRSFILAHHPAVTDDIRAQYGRKLALMGAGSAVRRRRGGHLAHRTKKLIGNPL